MFYLHFVSYAQLHSHLFYCYKNVIGEKIENGRAFRFCAANLDNGDDELTGLIIECKGTGLEDTEMH